MKENLRYMDCLENLGGVRAFYTTAAWADWKCNEEADPKAYASLGECFGITAEQIVRIPQSHTSNVRVLTKENGGEGIERNAAEGYDGMITNVIGLMPVTVEADCVPVYLYDPKMHAAGMIHSGWRGCAGEIAGEAVKMMQQHFASKPSDIYAAFGPCICKNCYEVGPELLDGFSARFSKITNVIFKPKENGKYLLDLCAAIRHTLLKAGLREDRIFDSPVCTFESSQLCSYRRDHDPDKRMLTGIMLTGVEKPL